MCSYGAIATNRGAAPTAGELGGANTSLRHVSRTFAAAIAVTAATLFGCATAPDSGKRPGGTVAYSVRVESSEPGVTIETNSVYAGKTPLQLKVLGGKDRTFHNFGSPQYLVRALPLNTNQFLQTQTFSTGDRSSPGARIPGLIFFNMNQKDGGFSIDVDPEN